MDAPAPWQSVPINTIYPQAPVQPELDYWLAKDFDGQPNDLYLGSHDCPAPSIRLVRNDKSSFGSELYFPIPPNLQPSNAFAQNFKAFHLAGNTDPVSLMRPVHPSESIQALQSGRNAFMHGPRQEGGHLDLLPTGSRVLGTTCSGYPLPNEAPSRVRLQESGTPPAIQYVAHSEARTVRNDSLLKNGEAIVVGRNPLNTSRSVMSPPFTPVPAPKVYDQLNLDQREVLVGMPNWVVLIKPLPLAGENVIDLRRDSNVALEIIPAHLPMGSLEEFDGIKVPATFSVKNFAVTTEKSLLECRIRLYGATTKELYESVCENCQKRMGKRRGTPSLIDFKAEYDMVEPKNGKIRVEFSFCCYPKCHRLGDTGYLMNIILSEDEDQNHIVAQCRLPFSFNILSKHPPGSRRSAIQGTSKRPRPEEDGRDPPASEQRAVRRRIDGTNTLARRNSPGNGQNHHPALDTDHQNASRGLESSSSSSLPLVPLHRQARCAGLGLAHLQAISPPMVDAEFPPILTEVNPDSGSTTGGMRIWLKGIDFPAILPLFARFGATVVATTFSSSNLLACHLPPRATPGIISITLSKHPQPNAPEYGTSIAKFKYIGVDDELIPILLRIRGQARSPLLQAILTALNEQGNSAPDPAINTHDPIQAQPRHGASGPTLGGVGPSKQLHEGTSMSETTPTWSSPTSIPVPLTHRPRGLAIPTSFMKQGVNHSVPLNTTAQQRQRSPVRSLYFSQFNNLCRNRSSSDSHSDSHSHSHSHPQSILKLTGSTWPVQPQVAAGNSQSSAPLHRTQPMGEMYGASAQLLVNHGESIGVQSPYEDNRHVTGMPSQWQQSTDSGYVYTATAPPSDLGARNKRAETPRSRRCRFDPHTSGYQHSAEPSDIQSNWGAASLNFSRLLGGRARTGSDPTTINIRSPASEAHLLQRPSVWSKIRSAIARVSSLCGLFPPTTVQTLHSTTSGGGPVTTHKNRHTRAMSPEWSPFVAPRGDSFRVPKPPSAFDDTQRSHALQGENHGTIRRNVPIETGLIEALRRLQGQPNFREMISTTNDWGQTLAHLSIFYGYASLLDSLVDWCINLTIADVNGFTALHYAYMKGDLDSIRILRRGGASETVVDKLGRTPLDMQPEIR